MKNSWRKYLMSAVLVTFLFIGVNGCEKKAELGEADEMAPQEEGVRATKEVIISEVSPDELFGVVDEKDLREIEQAGDPDAEIEATFERKALPQELAFSTGLITGQPVFAPPIVGLSEMRAVTGIFAQPAMTGRPKHGGAGIVGEGWTLSRKDLINYAAGAIITKFNIDLHEMVPALQEVQAGMDMSYRKFLGDLRKTDAYDRLYRDAMMKLRVLIYDYVIEGKSPWDILASGMKKEQVGGYLEKAIGGKCPAEKFLGLGKCGAMAWAFMNEGSYGLSEKETKDVGDKKRYFFPRAYLRERMISLLFDSISRSKYFEFESDTGYAFLIQDQNKRGPGMNKWAWEALLGRENYEHDSPYDGVKTEILETMFISAKKALVVQMLAGLTTSETAWEWWKENVFDPMISDRKIKEATGLNKVDLEKYEKDLKDALDEWANNMYVIMTESRTGGDVDESVFYSSNNQKDTILKVMREEGDKLEQAILASEHISVIPSGREAAYAKDMKQKFHQLVGKMVVDNWGVTDLMLDCGGRKWAHDQPGTNDDQPINGCYSYRLPDLTKNIFDVTMGNCAEDCKRKWHLNRAFRPNPCNAGCYVREKAYKDEKCGGICFVKNWSLRFTEASKYYPLREKVLAIFTEAMMNASRKLPVDSVSKACRTALMKAFRYGPPGPNGEGFSEEFGADFMNLKGKGFEDRPSNFGCFNNEAGNGWAPNDKFYILQVAKERLAYQVLLGNMTIEQAIQEFKDAVLSRQANISCVAHDATKALRLYELWEKHLNTYFTNIEATLNGDVKYKGKRTDRVGDERIEVEEEYSCAAGG